jgi:hypothetical protein
MFITGSPRHYYSFGAAAIAPVTTSFTKRQREHMNAQDLKNFFRSDNSRQTLSAPRVNVDGKHNCGSQTKKPWHCFVPQRYGNTTFGHAER